MNARRAASSSLPSAVALVIVVRSSVATEWVKGKTMDECLAVTNKDIAAHLKLPPVKLHCSMLAEDAIKAAIHDIKAKRGE